MSAKQPYYFTVKGSGTFPIDMLRYDRCWPSSENSVYAMLKSEKRFISLCSFYEPTAERWKSFEWEVGEVTVG